MKEKYMNILERIHTTPSISVSRSDGSVLEFNPVLYEYFIGYCKETVLRNLLCKKQDPRTVVNCNEDTFFSAFIMHLTGSYRKRSPIVECVKMPDHFKGNKTFSAAHYGDEWDNYAKARDERNEKIYDVLHKKLLRCLEFAQLHNEGNGALILVDRYQDIVFEQDHILIVATAALISDIEIAE